MRAKITAILFIMCFLVLIMASGCSSKEPESETAPEVLVENHVYVIEDESDIPLEYSTYLKKEVIVLHSKYCSACKVIIPKLENIEKELDLTFEYLDLSEESARQRAVELGVVPHYTPTVIIDGKVLIGAYPENVYKDAIVQAFS